MDAEWYCHVKVSPSKQNNGAEWEDCDHKSANSINTHYTCEEIHPPHFDPYIARESHQHQQRGTSRTKSSGFKAIRCDATLSLLFTIKWKTH